MMKTVARAVRHRRVRSRLSGTAERPRLVVFRGSRTLSAQLVDDAGHAVLASAAVRGSTVTAAEQLGADIAKRAGTKKITTAVFDRAGYAYHGAVKAVAEAARKGGLKL